MRPLLTLLAIASLSVPLAACGGTASQRSGSLSAVSAPTHRASTCSRSPVNAESPPHYAGVPRYPRDDDGDNDSSSDENIRTFGHEADRTDARAMAATLRRYYAFAARDEGGRACAMLTRAIRKAVPLEYGLRAGHRRQTCAAIVTGIFRHFHPVILSEARKMRVIDARLEGEKGYVVVRPHSPCVRSMCVLNLRELLIAKLLMQREDGAWKVEALLLKV
jgi:hypothetical protein